MSVSQQQEDPGVALDTGTDELLCRVADGVALVTLNKPHKNIQAYYIAISATTILFFCCERLAR